MKREVAERKGDAPPPDTFAADARAAGFLGETPRLPKSSRAATKLMKIAIDHGAAKPAELEGWFGKELQKRIEGGDAVALEIACALAQEAAPEQLDALERIGWEKHSDAACVCGLLRRKGAKDLKRDDPLLVAALAKCGDDPRVVLFEVALAQRDKTGVTEAATRLALAQMRRLVSIHDTQPVIRLLEKELAPPPPPK